MRDDDEAVRVQRSTIEDFKLRVAEFRTRLAALERELAINLEHEDSHGAFLYIDDSDDCCFHELWLTGGDSLHIRDTRDAPVRSFYGKNQP